MNSLIDQSSDRSWVFTVFLTVNSLYTVLQGSHRLEKYSNLEDFLEKSLIINLP